MKTFFHLTEALKQATNLSRVFEILLQKFTDVSRHQRTILVSGEPVIEHPQALVPPHPHKAGRSIESLWCGEEEAMVDTGEVPEVEDVVELGGGGGKVSHYPLVQLHGGSSDGFRELLDTWGGECCISTCIIMYV